MTFPQRYLPPQLSAKDKQTQLRMLNKSKKLYRKHQYYTRTKVKSFRSKPSRHVQRARRIYGVEHIVPNQELARKTGCPVSALQQIVKKGEGAYYSSGSRPNQTPQSWGLARLASAITAGNASLVDYSILQQCNPRGKAFLLAKTRQP
jgi:hypothetical protein